MLNHFMIISRLNPKAIRALPWLLALLAATVPAALHAGDWPRWRGANFDGISTETGWLTQWPADGPKRLWQAAVGVGYASVSVSQGRVFTMGNKDDADSVFAFDAATGKEIWHHSYPCSAKDPNGYPGPRVTPTVDDGRVFSLSRTGLFFCLEAATGKVLWSKEFAKDYNAKPPTWGFAGSPLAEGNVVITEVGGTACVVAFDKLDGHEVWKTSPEAVAYSSMVPFDAGGQRCLAELSAVGLVGRAAKDGSELWRFPWKTSYDVSVATPIVVKDRVFVSSGYGKGCALIQFGGGPAKAVWQNKLMRNHVATCVLWQGNLYGFDESELKCLAFDTGEQKWAEGKFGKGNLMLADGKLIIYSQTGTVAVAEASPAGFKELASYKVFEGKDTWAPPVLANGRLYCRSANDLVCLDVKAP
jgi:outer membrane protein assembly factor BamB